MDDLKRLDAVHSGPLSETSTDTIEMDNLEESRTHAEHRHQLKEDYALPKPDTHEDSDSDEDSGDGAETSLLRPGEWTGGREGQQENKPSLWIQSKRIVIETGPTLLLTTIGLLFTGELLNNVSHWKAMSQIDELIMIIPVVLNLKGNLEMNLSARLGTAANMGELDKPRTRRAIILGNLSLLQVQATVVSFVAACVAFVLSRVISKFPIDAPAMTDSTSTARALHFVRSIHHDRRPRPPQRPQAGPGGLMEFAITASSAMLAACLSSVLLGSFMCTLVVLCRRFNLDPDNVAPPIAACLGDLVTLSLLGVVSAVHIFFVKTPLPFIVIVALTVAAVGWAIVTRRNPHVRHLLLEGWVPLFAAMVISCGTGIVLDHFVAKYEGFALLATVISGLPGNVGAVFVSRLSTALHTATHAFPLPTASTDDFARDLKPRPHPPNPRLVMIILLLVTFPIELIFLSVLNALGWLHVPLVFTVFSVLFFCVAVTTSLILAYWLTNFLWKWNLDPDMYALPIHSALMDLIGQLLLVACFEIVARLGVHMKPPAPPPA